MLFLCHFGVILRLTVEWIIEYQSKHPPSSYVAPLFVWMRRLVAIEAGNKNCFATQGFQEQGRGKELVRLEEIGTAMISLEECCWEMQLQQQRQQLVVVPIRVRKDGWASDAMLYVSAIFSGLLFPHPPPPLSIALPAICSFSGIALDLDNIYDKFLVEMTCSNERSVCG